MQPNAPQPPQPTQQQPANQPRPVAPAISPAGASKIQHSRPGISIGAPASAASAAPSPTAPQDAPVQLNAAEPSAPTPAPGTAGSKIRMFGQDKRHEEQWSRTPNTTGSGAIHVKTFHCKLTEDALTYMDQAVNEWLDAHPQYEVKFVSSSIGTMTGKLKEPALICQVWV